MIKSGRILSYVSSIVISTAALGAGITHTTAPYDGVENPRVAAKILIDVAQKGPTIPDTFYGSHFDSYSPAPSAQLIKELGLGQIRMGGNEYDVFNWQNGYASTTNGPRQLPGFINSAATLRNYQIPGVYQINLLGFQPEQENGKYVLRNTFNSEAAADLIRTLNGTMKLNLVNFSLGNEPEQWHETHSSAWGLNRGITADEYIARYIEFAIAIRRAQESVNGDPNSIKIWGPEISDSWYDWNTGNFTQDCQWSGSVRGQVVCKYGGGKFDHFLPYFLDSLAKAEKNPTLNPKGYKLLDYFAFHYYPTLRSKISDLGSAIKDPEGRQWVSKMLESTRIFNDPNYINTVDISSYRGMAPNIFNRMKQWRDSYYPDAQLALNEFAVDADYRSTKYHPIVRPLYLADTVAIAATEGLSFFNNFILSSNAGANVPWVMLDGPKRTNLFYTYALLANHFKGTVLHTEDNMGDVVNSYATEDGDKVHVALINKSPLDKEVQIYLKNGAERKIATYKVPGWSTSVLELIKTWSRGKGTYIIDRFGADEMGIPKDPNYAKY